MKKIIRLILLLFVLLSLALNSACSSKENKTDKSSKETQASVTKKEDEERNELKEKLVVDEQILVDQDGLLIVLKSINEGKSDISFKVYLENNTDKKINVVANEVSVNGIMIEPFFSVEMAPGKKANGNIGFSNSELKDYNIDLIREVELKFAIYEYESWENLINTEAITIHTNANQDYEQTVDDSGQIAFEESGFKVVFKGIDYKSNTLGPEIKVFLENKSENDVIFQITDVSINGYMVEPIFSVDVAAGKVSYDSITFFAEDFENNDIDSINEMEFKVLIFNSYDWETIVESSQLKITWE